MKKKDPGKGRIAGLVIATVGVLALLTAVLGGCTDEEPVEPRIQSLYGADDAQFPRAMGSMLGPPVLPGNTIQTLINGEEIFPSMLAAIASAERSVTFETYVYWSGSIGKRFADALSERARAGVQVLVLIDSLGSQKIDDDSVRSMTDAGVKVERYHPVHWYHLDRINNRTHRKLLVIDGKLGFTGGVGIADEWLGDARNPKEWRDTHFRVEGPVVAQLQSAFFDNWMEVTGEVLHGDVYFPAPAPAGSVPAQMYSSSPGGGVNSMQLMYLIPVTAARKSIKLSASYFVPDEVAIKAMLAARQRGVTIDIIVPGKQIDASLVRSASRARWGELLEAGVRIYEYQPTMFHCKVLVVDGGFVSVGSTNFDPRSFHLNDEANLNAFNSAFAAEQEKVFAEDLAKAKQITYEMWKDRPLMEKLKERAASLFGGQM